MLVKWELKGDYYSNEKQTPGSILDEILAQNKLNHNSASEATFTFTHLNTEIQIKLTDVGEHK